jgi:peptidoglycan/xylan/chitin deacetylase (PgdA/CDA1 family)
MFDIDDVRTAHRVGHEIACHTYTHLNCRHATGRAILDEVRRNADMLCTLIPGYAPTNFAYPYGAVSLAAKRTLATQFSTCRGISPGINQTAVNLAELLATRIYAADFDQKEIRRLIDRNRSAGGWLIFYTHDVIETPSPYGCTPRQLEGVVAYAANCATILPVRDVITALGAGRGKPATLESRPAIRQL